MKISPPRPGTTVTLVVFTLFICGSYIILRVDLADRTQAIAKEGHMLTQLIASFAPGHFFPSKEDSPKEIDTKDYSNHPALAYIFIFDSAERLVAKTSNKDLSFSQASLNPGISSNYNIDHLKSEIADKKLINFHRTILDGQYISGFVHIGFHQPKINFSTPAKLHFTLALVSILLISTTFILSAKADRKLIQKINKHLIDLTSSRATSDLITSRPGALGTLINNLNQFASTTTQTINSLEEEIQDAETLNSLLHYHKRKMELLLQYFPQPTVLLDIEGAVTFANRAFATLIDLPLDNVIGKQADEWCKDDNVVSLLTHYYGNVTSLYRNESVKYCPEGRDDKIYLVSPIPISPDSEPGNIIGTLVIFQDISNETRIRESRDEFIAHISHELKSPLNVINMQAELLAELNEDNPGNLIEGVNIIQDEVGRLAILITDLLNITKFESGSVSLNIQRIKMPEFLTDTFDTAMRPAESKNIKTISKISRSLGVLNIDKELFRIALNNLLTNAIKYTDPGGTITLEAEEADSHIKISITDTGVGIGMQDQPRIFEKFYRSENHIVRDRPGHGLGLSLSKQIIDLHNGNITVKSDIGKGSTFVIAMLKSSSLLKEAV